MKFGHSIRTVKLYFIFFSLCSSCLCGATETKEIRHLSFTQLTGLHDFSSKEASVTQLKRDLLQFHNFEVSVRGFLYQNVHGEYLLSSEPNLKSCCIGTSEKASQQIFLSSEINFIAARGVVTARGIFTVDPEWDEQGKLLKLYRLKNVQIATNSHWPVKTIILSLLVSGIFLFLLKLLLKRASKAPTHA